MLGVKLAAKSGPQHLYPNMIPSVLVLRIQVQMVPKRGIEEVVLVKISDPQIVIVGGYPGVGVVLYLLVKIVAQQMLIPKPDFMQQPPGAEVVEIPRERKFVLQFEFLSVDETTCGNIKFNVVVNGAAQALCPTKQVAVVHRIGRRNTNQAAIQGAVIEIDAATERKPFIGRQIDRYIHDAFPGAVGTAAPKRNG